MPYTKSPLRYPGGKTSIYKYIRELVRVNNATTYIEPFAGGCGVALALLLNNDISQIIVNDVDPSIFAFWYSVKNYSTDLIYMIENIEISVDEWEKQKSIQKQRDISQPVMLGFSTLFLNRTNRSGIIKGGMIGGKEQSGKYKLDCRFTKETTIRKIKAIAAISERIKVTNLDAVDFIDRNIIGNRNSLTFFDPPYFNKGPELYTNFYDEDDHLNLANKIKSELSDYKWIVTYDHCSEINAMYSGLRALDYFLTYSAQRKRLGLEYMFFSDCTFQGDYQKYLRLNHEQFTVS